MGNSTNVDLFQRFMLGLRKITLNLGVADPGVDTNTFQIPHLGRLSTPVDKCVPQYTAALPYEGLLGTPAQWKVRSQANRLAKDADVRFAILNPNYIEYCLMPNIMTPQAIK